jgi:release factor glutamine methyltransferase
VHALDRSEDALAVARHNALQLGLPVQLHCGSWLDHFAGVDGLSGPLSQTGVQAQFHAIVSNPPYIAAGDEHLNALRHEPLPALVSGSDGLDDLRHIVQQAPAWLLEGGWLLLEHGHGQAAAVRTLLRKAGLQHVQSRRDLAGIERCSGGQRLSPDKGLGPGLGQGQDQNLI